MSFLTDYLHFSTKNEAPRIFHETSALSVLSAAIGRKVRICNGMFIFYPNIFTILVGDPGCGKSTALDMGKALIREIKGHCLTADSMTVQAMTQWMAGSNLKDGVAPPCKKTYKLPDNTIQEYTQANIVVGELVSFLNVDPHNWIVFLTNIFNEEVHEVKTKNKGDDLIVGPYVTVFGCLTPDISQQMQTAKIISTGFARRTLFVWANKRGAPIALFDDYDKRKDPYWKRCVEWLNGLASVKGDFNWEAAKPWYEEWYYGKFQQEKAIVSPQVKGYYDSKNMQLLKVAMLMSLAERTDLVLTPDHCQQALSYLERIEQNLHKVFGGAGRNEDAQTALAILEMLEKNHEAIPRKKLLSIFWENFRDRDKGFDSVISYLKQTDRIKEWVEQIGEAQITMIATPEGMRKFRSKVAATPAKTPAAPSPSPGNGRVVGFVVEFDQPSGHAEGHGQKPEQVILAVEGLDSVVVTSEPPKRD